MNKNTKGLKISKIETRWKPNPAVVNVTVDYQLIVGVNTSETHPVDLGLYLLQPLPGFYFVTHICWRSDGESLGCRVDTRFHDWQIPESRGRWIFRPREDVLKEIVGRVVYVFKSLNPDLTFPIV